MLTEIFVRELRANQPGYPSGVPLQRTSQYLVASQVGIIISYRLEVTGAVVVTGSPSKTKIEIPQNSSVVLHLSRAENITIDLAEGVTESTVKLAYLSGI